MGNEFSEHHRWIKRRMNRHGHIGVLGQQGLRVKMDMEEMMMMMEGRTK
jgi:hypothetical protein